MIKIENVSKTLKYEDVLKNINIELKPGVIYGFVGRNGSGKSMLFKTISGFVRPNEGEVIVLGERLYEKNAFPKDTRGLIEKPGFLENLSGFENLKLLGDIQNKITDKDIEEVLKLFDLDKNKKVGHYSLGMKQKLGIAQVLMENPKIMILDEPFSGLDQKSVERVREILLEEKKKDKIILLASHIKDDIEILCDVIHYMDAGEIIKTEIVKESN